MKRTCKYCGIVDENHICPHRKEYKKKEFTQARKFRNSKSWQTKSQEIRQRDRHLCRICMIDKYNTVNQLNYKKLEVHHIISLEQDYSKRLDNDNLITLCSYHHHMAEAGDIPAEELQRLAKDKVIK